MQKCIYSLESGDKFLHKNVVLEFVEDISSGGGLHEVLVKVHNGRTVREAEMEFPSRLKVDVL